LQWFTQALIPRLLVVHVFPGFCTRTKQWQRHGQDEVGKVADAPVCFARTHPFGDAPKDFDLFAPKHNYRNTLANTAGGVDVPQIWLWTGSISRCLFFKLKLLFETHNSH